MKHQSQTLYMLIKRQYLMSLLIIGGVFSNTDVLSMPIPKGGMPSVADVFGNLSEQEIAEQVKMGQQFLEDLQKNGSAEEREAFEKLLMETLNSMSEQDFKDIQDIATMVEPHIQPAIQPTEEPKPVPSTPIEVKPTAITTPITSTSNAVDDFKQLISIISQRIDDIMQKIDSSKECAEQADVLWKNRTTFNNMKRQLYQLRNDRLASKLAKDDLDGNDKKLVEKLQKFHKELTRHNDAFVIQDDFGLPASYKEEKKHLKQTKEIISMFDEYIDNLMPLLEKFLRTWDPEALQMAKESEERSKIASKDALDATQRKASLDALKPIGGGPSYGQAPSYSTPAYYDNYSGQGNYQDYGSGYPQSAYPQSGSDVGSTGSKSKGSGTGSGATPATELKKDAPIAEKPKRSSVYENVIGDLNDHVEELFPSKHVDEFLTFMKKDMVDAYQDLSLDDPNNEGTKPYKMPGVGRAWINNTFVPYIENVNSQLNNKFYPELDEIKDILQNTKGGIEEMTTEELSKLQNNKDLDILERRLTDYHSAFKTAEAAIEQKFKNNAAPAPVPEADNIVSPTTNIFLDPLELRDYTAAHTSFIRGLKLNMETKIAELQNLIRSTKKRAKSRAEKMQKEGTVSTKS